MVLSRYRRYIIETSDAYTAQQAQCAMADKSLFPWRGDWYRVLRVSVNQDIEVGIDVSPLKIRPRLLFLISVEMEQLA
jgi:hypothetical protein